MREGLQTIVGIFVVAACVVGISLCVHLGFFTLNAEKQHHYTLYFDDCAGLTKKSDVKIAGVKVGMVNSVTLDRRRAIVTISVAPDAVISADACAVVRQEGLVGAKYLDIDPGSDTASRAVEGSVICGKSNSLSMDDVLARLSSAIQSLEKSALRCVEILEQNDIRPAIASCTKVCDELADTACVLRQTITLARDGNGAIGTLLTDKKTGNAVQTVTYAVDRCADAIKNTRITLDTFGYFLPPISQNTSTNFLGEFDVRVIHREKYLFMGGILGATYGYVTRSDERRTEFGRDCIETTPAFFERHTVCKRENVPLFNAQLGAIHKRLIGRVGLFESSFGFGFDYLVPGFEPYGSCMTTLELFDLRGRNRLCSDGRPHLRWKNRLFAGDYFYIMLGVDEILSPQARSFLVGAGLMVTNF